MHNFSDEQVEAAAKALRADEGFMEEVHSALEVSWSEYIARLVLTAAQGAAPQKIGRLDLARHYWRSQGYDYDLHGLDGNNDYEMGLAVADAALAALAAAQGAAPQTESEELAWYKKAAKHSADSMAEARATLQQLADRVDPFVFDELSSVLDDQPLDYETGWAIGEPAPVLPSNTAPQAESEYVYCPIHGDLLAARRSFVCEHAKKGHEYGSPVLPSSGVDVAKIERLIMGRTATAGARAVAAWLKDGAQ